MKAQKSMKLQTVICELNPLHNGHKYIIDRAHEDCDVLAAVMSGNFTERALPAVFDKYTRAGSAILAGFDIVVELPFPWCCAGAEGFALGGSAIAAGLLSQGLTFGSESGDFSYIEQLARLKGSEEFSSVVKETEKNARSLGAAEIFDRTIAKFGLMSSGGNDKLGAEYIRYGRSFGIESFNPIKRLEGIQSATELRGTEISEWSESIPQKVFDALCMAKRYEDEGFNTVLFNHARIYLDNAISEPLCIARKKARETVSADEFAASLATKKYTSARMRRELLFSVLAVSPESVYKKPEYTLLLAANERGRKYLSENRRSLALPVIVKPADCSAVSDIGYRLHSRADELYSLINGLPADWFIKQKPMI